MALQGIDIAWARPTTGQILATGAKWVGRYLSNDTTKNLRLDEVASYPAAGLAIIVVWETTTGRALDGFAAGQADARAAESQRRALGLPNDMPIHFAVDTDTGWANVASYFQGAASIIGAARVGTYGGYNVIEGAAAAGYRYLWQTIAWSGGRWSTHATIRQTGGTALQGQADVDQAVVADFGQYPRPTTVEPDMTPDELLNTRMPAFAGIPQANGTVYLPTVAEVLNGAKTADSQLAALKAEVDQIKTAVAALSALQLTDAQVKALAAQVAPALAPALLTAMGHKLDGTA